MRQKAIVFIAVAVALVLLCIGALTLQTPGSGSEYRLNKPYSDADGTEMVSLTVNDFTFQINTRAPDSVYEVTWLTTEFDTIIQIGDFSACRIWIDGQEVMPKQTLALALDVISRDRMIPVRILDERTDWDRTVYIKTWPENLRTVSLVNYGDEATELPNILYAADDYLVKCDAKGNVIFYRLTLGASDFQSVVTDSGKYYTFLENGSSGGQDSILDIPTRQAVVLNEQYQVIDIIQGTPMEDGTIPIVKYGFQMLNERDYILASAVPDIAYENGAFSNGEPMGTHIVDYIVSRIKEGEVLWQWDSLTTNVLERKPATTLLGTFDGGSGFADFMKLSDIAWDKPNSCVYLAWQELDGLIRLDAESGTEGWIDLLHGTGTMSVDCGSAYKAILRAQDGAGTEVLSSETFDATETLIHNQFRETTAHGSVSVDGTGRYVLVFYGETSSVAGSVFDSEERTTAMDILFSRRGEEETLDRMTFERNS